MKRRAAVAICLVSIDGIVALERKASNHVNEPAMLVFPGGHIEPGESPICAAERELYEELGILPGKLRLDFLETTGGYITASGEAFKMYYLGTRDWDGAYDRELAKHYVFCDVRAAQAALNKRRVEILRRCLERVRT